MRQRREFRELDLGIREVGDGWWVTVYASPGGGDVEGTLIAHDTGERLLDMARARDAGVVLRDARRGEPSQRSLGEALFTALLGGEIAGSFRRGRRGRAGLYLTLRLGGAGRLRDLPWELLHDPEDSRPLAARGDVSIARYLEQSIAPSAPRAEPPLRILIAAAAVPGMPELDTEGEVAAIERGLRNLGSAAYELEILRNVTLPRLEAALSSRAFQVVHVVAHGEARPDGEPALLLDCGDGSPDRVEASRLASVIGRRRGANGPPGLVVLNACHGAQEGLASPLSGLAPALVRSQIPAVVAMQGPIGDEAAVAFASQLYDELASGEPIHAAVASARRALHIHPAHTSFFATPVYFARCRDEGLVARTERRFVAPLLAILAALLLGAGVVRFWPTEPPVVAGETSLASPMFQNPPGDPRCPSPPGLDLPMRYVRGGRYEIGSDDGRVDERPIHTVDLDAFCIGRFEVKQEEFRDVMGDDPAPSVRAPDRPMDRVTWEEVREFIRRVDARVEDGNPFRLPTEAEWEVAARAGTTTAFSFGDDPAELWLHGNCRSPGIPDDGYDSVAPVAEFAPNRWGLYDMHGNLSEWVADRYRAYPGGEAEPDFEGDRRVRRGGSYKTGPDHCRSARRNASAPDYRSPDVGFRLAREPLPGA